MRGRLGCGTSSNSISAFLLGLEEGFEGGFEGGGERTNSGGGEEGDCKSGGSGGMSRFGDDEGLDVESFGLARSLAILA